MALTKQLIVAEAITLLDEGGLDAVTLRKLAQRLGVRAPTLYWHIRNKAELINELAEVILKDLTELSPPAEDEPWRDWLTVVAQRMREAMLAHPDGAQVVSAAHLSPTLAAVSELAMSTLVRRGLHLRQARLTVLAIQRFIIGHVLEEQSPPPGREVLHDFDAESFAAQHPTITAGIADYFQDGRTVDDLFHDSLEVILQ